MSTPLPSSDASTAVVLATEASLASIDAKMPEQGQGEMGEAMPVAIAADQTPLPIAQPVLVDQGTPGTTPWPALAQGTDGALVYALATDASGIIYASTLQEAISRGRIVGRVDNVVGETATAATTETPVRGTAYVEQASGAQRSVASSSANDTAGGTGARTVRLVYFTLTAGVVAGPFNETITLNGLTPVNTVASDIALVESMTLLTVGSGEVAAGAISLFAASGGAGGAIASISAGRRRTLYAHRFVPSGRVGRITSVSISSTGGGIQYPKFVARWKSYSMLDAAEQVLFEAYVNGTSSTHRVPYAIPRSVPGPARIVYYVTATNAAVQTHSVDSDYWEI